MKRSLAFIKKEFLHIIRDKRTLLIVFAMPVVLVMLFGFAITTEVKDARIAILDNSKDELSVGLVSKLTSSGYFMPERVLDGNSDIETVFADGKIKMVVVIAENFSRDFYGNDKANIQLIADATDPNAATTIINYASSIIKDFQREKSNLPSTSGVLDITTKMLYNAELKSVYMFVPGVLALVLAIISAMMTAISLTKEKEFGTLKVLSVSPLKPITIISGKVIPYLIISVIDTMIILLLSKFVFGMPLSGNLVLILTVCILFLLTSMSMGILIASFVSTQQIAATISIVGLFMPTTLLSGFIYPIENMPLPLQYVCQIFPARWFIEAIKDVMIKGVGVRYVWVELTVMASMTILLLSVSLRKFSKTIRR